MQKATNHPSAIDLKRTSREHRLPNCSLTERKKLSIIGTDGLRPTCGSLHADSLGGAHLTTPDRKTLDWTECRPYIAASPERVATWRRTACPCRSLHSPWQATPRAAFECADPLVPASTTESVAWQKIPNSRGWLLSRPAVENSDIAPKGRYGTTTGGASVMALTGHGSTSTWCQWSRPSKRRLSFIEACQQLRSLCA
jgi:hypothetical protein